MSKSVNVSIATNSIIMILKLFGYLTTGSPTLFAETIHSGTDVFKQGLLKIGEVKSLRESTRLHPFGFRKEKFFWALVASIAVLFLGCGVSIRHGIEALYHSEPGAPFTTFTIALLVLGGFLELYTLIIAWKEIGGWKGLSKAKTNTTILAVLLEDGVALLGIALTLFVAFWSKFAGPAPQMDAFISIFVGIMLGGMGIMLAKLNKEILIDVADNVVDEEVERVIEEKSGIKIKAASSLLDSDRCLLFLHVFPEDIPSHIDFSRLGEVTELIKDHIASIDGKNIDHVYWQFRQPLSVTKKKKYA